MATPKAGATPKNPFSTTPNRPTASPRPNMTAFAQRHFGGKSPAVKTPASAQGHSHRISVSSAPTATPFNAATIQDELLNFSSPNNAALMASLGQTGLTPVGSGQDGLALGANMTAVPGQTVSVARDPQAERLARVKEVANTLKKHAIGRGISRDNIIALVQIAGLEIAPLDNDKPDTVNILGQRIIDMEVDFSAQQRDVVERVQLKLMLPDQDEPVQQPQMSQILKQNLIDERHQNVPWTLLDDFSYNIDYLARMDKVDTTADVFHAVDNLYDTFRRIWDEEKSRMKWRHDLHHACQSNVGRPSKDANGRIGLRTKYWDRGGNAQKESTLKEEPGWTAEFACEKSPLGMVASQKWLEDLALTTSVTTEHLFQDTQVDKPAWLDELSLPKPKIAENQDAMDVDDVKMDTDKSLDIQFTCCLEPAVLLPVHVINTLNTGFDLLIADQNGNVSFQNALGISSDPNAKWSKDTTMFDGKGIPHNKTHSFSFASPNNPNPYRISKLRFTHPRQYADTLPHLRQYALLETLLSSIAPKIDSRPSLDQSPSPSGVLPQKRVDAQPKKRSNKRADQKLTALLNNLSTLSEILPIEISLDLHTDLTKPRIHIRFPVPPAIAASNKARSPNTKARSFLGIIVEVKPNGIIEVPDIQGLEIDNKEEFELLRKKMAKALRVSEDVGMSVEWLFLQLAA